MDNSGHVKLANHIARLLPCDQHIYSHVFFENSMATLDAVSKFLAILAFRIRDANIHNIIM